MGKMRGKRKRETVQAAKEGRNTRSGRGGRRGEIKRWKRGRISMTRPNRRIGCDTDL